MKQVIGVMIDSREPEWVKQLTFGGMGVSVVQLEAGDVHLGVSDGAMIVIERKTPHDFLQSLREGRLFNQVAELARLTRWAYIVITGEFTRTAGNKVMTYRVTGWDWNALQGAILTIQEMGVMVCQCAGDADFEGAVTRIALRDRQPVKIAPPRGSRVLSEGEAMIATLPGIGLDRLETVLRYCKTPAQALVALTDAQEHDHLPGVGIVTRKRIRRALKMEDGISFSLIAKEN